MTDAPRPRKLATILAIDIAGYSRVSERDDGEAARAVSSLRRVAGEEAARHGGRIFNTAGDSTMLEFPSASSGAAAANAILNRKDETPKIRAGLHIGEVTELENGDLLGHGVNVAARLEQAAAPGTALVSEAVRSLVRDNGAIGFQPAGRIMLDKMGETVEAFVIGAGGKAVMPMAVHRRRVRGAVMLVLGLIAGSALFLALNLIGGGANRNEAGGAPAQAEAPPAAPAGGPLVAVLPFYNTSEGDELKFFSDGVTDEIRFSLSRMPGLRVASRASSAEFAGDQARPADIAKALGATHILAGKIHRTGDAMRLSTELISASNGELLWTENFERPIADAVKVQNEIAFRVARVLQVVVPESAKAGPAIDAAAYDLYLRGRDAWRRGGGRGGGGDAIGDLEQAVKLAPGFARAWAALASAYAQRQNFAVGPEQDALVAKALEAAGKAIALDPGMGEPYIVLGRFEPSGDWGKRMSLLKQGLEREPNDPDVMGLYANFGPTMTGRVVDALSMYQRAYAGDSFSDLRVNQYLAALVDARDYRKAEEVLTAAEAREPWNGINWLVVAAAKLLDGDLAGAKAARERADAAAARAGIELTSSAISSEMMAQLNALERWKTTGDPAAGEALLDMVRKSVELGQTNALGAITTFSYAGRLDEAFALADRLFTPEGFAATKVEGVATPGRYPYGRAAPGALFSRDMRPMLKDKRIWPVFVRIGLAQYWLDSGQWPDFCSQADLGYDCREEAEKALAAQKAG